MLPAGAIRFDPYQPFTRAEAHAAGLSDHHLRSRQFRTLLHGVRVHAAVPDSPLLRVRAALMVHPAGAVATHYSSARVLGVPVPSHPLEHVSVARDADRRHRHGLRCHVAALADSDIRIVEGLRLSAPARMFLELASCLDLVDLVVVGDWLVRQGHLTPRGLVSYCQQAHDRYARRASTAAAYVRERVDSPMETRLRMLLVLAGLPEPRVNLELRDENGAVTMRLDLSYPTVRLAVEYDGRQHVQRDQQWERDIERRDELDRRTWRLLVVTSTGIYREPSRTVERVWEALRDRGYRPLPRPHDGWRPHFTR